MNRFLKTLVSLIAFTIVFSSEAYSKKREEKITPDREYAYSLDSPVASMVIEYHLSSGIPIREEFIYEEGSTEPAYRIIREYKGRSYADDSLLYNKEGRVVRVGKYRDFEMKERERVEYFEGNNHYHPRTIPPIDQKVNTDPEPIILSDFDSNGNWRKAYFTTDKKNPVLTRTISYKYSPEYEALISQHPEMLQNTENKIVSEKNMVNFILHALWVIPLILLIVCVLVFTRKNSNGGKGLWISILIFGLPVASFLYMFIIDFISGSDYASYKPFVTGAMLVLYMLLMRWAIMSMSNDRKLSNDFINTFNVIWGVWTFFTLSPSFMSSIMPNFFGRILSWLLPAVLTLINYAYTISRCPVCHRPHSLVLDHVTDDGVIQEHSHRTSVRKSKPEVTGLYLLDDSFGGTIKRNVTQNDTHTTKTYQAYSNHYKCVECGHTYTVSGLKGKLLHEEVNRTTTKYKEKIKFD